MQAQVEFGLESLSDPGTYILELDLVHERVSWFGGQGNPTLKLPVTILPDGMGHN